MLKQRESEQFSFESPSRKNYYAIFIAWLILISLTNQESKAQTPSFGKEPIALPEDKLTRRDSLISWPFVLEVKKQKTAEILLKKLLAESTLSTYSRTNYITSEKINNRILKTPPGKEPYLDFCLFRKTFDTQWIQEKSMIVIWYTAQWYTETQAYILHQNVCYKLNQPYGKHIYLANSAFYTHLAQQMDYYQVSWKNVLRGYFWSTYDNLLKEPSNENHWTPDPAQFRKQPQKEKVKIGARTIEHTAYDRKSAYEKLTQHGISLRSTAKQHEEDWSSPEHFRTCVEWLSEETIDAIILLKQTLEEQLWKKIELVVNGWTEKWHWKECYLLAWFKKPWYVLKQWDEEAHGLTFSFDIRCQGEWWIALRDLFPQKRSTKILADKKWTEYIYKCLFHEDWLGLHGHFTAMKLSTRNKLH
jgi:hypothetical protein